MASELRVNNIKNRSGLGTVTFTDNGLLIAGITSLSLGDTNLIVGSATSTGTASQRLQVTGGAYVSGSVGIGTTNPTSRLQINTSGTGGIKLVSTSGADTTTSNILSVPGDGALYFDTDSTGSWNGYENILFNVAGTNLLKLTKDNGSNWSVLVGSTSYSFQGLDVNGNIGINGQTIFDINRNVTRSLLPDTNNSYDLGSSSLGWKRGYFLDNVLIGSATSTGTASQRLQVTGGAYVSGNLGVGITNPQQALHVVGIITATSYRGDGSQLTGVSAGNDITSCLFT